ncbi:DUF3040 domain-containing protein [Streptomyces sp. NPDC002221]|uniref:DUF3040 domain-containing protein n=1 Tax=Streptomyces sp. NPDC002221 TaxID=3364639 RepID=UPI0036C9A5C0
MEETELSREERDALDSIEEALCRDHRLSRRMAGRERRRLRLPLVVGVLTFASVGLLIQGIRTSEPAVIWSFAVVWPLALVSACWLLWRWAAGSRDGDADGPLA